MPEGRMAEELDANGKTLSVVVSQLVDLREDIKEMRSDIRSNTVARGEWIERNTHIDGRLASQLSQINDIRLKLETQRAPWWTLVTVMVAVGALLWTMFGPLG